MGILSRPAPVWAKELLCKMQQLEEQLEEGLEQLMALVSIEQTDLDTLSTDLAAAVAAVGTEITNLEAAVAAAGTPLPAGSLDALKAGVASLVALEVPAPAPTPTPAPAPAPEPTPPPVTPPADVPPAV